MKNEMSGHEEVQRMRRVVESVPRKPTPMRTRQWGRAERERESRRQREREEGQRRRVDRNKYRDNKRRRHSQADPGCVEHDPEGGYWTHYNTRSVFSWHTRKSSSPTDSRASTICQEEEDEKTDPKDIFPFLKLPAELRVNIYRMALQRDEPLLLHLQRYEKEDDDGIHTRETDIRPPKSTHASAAASKSINVALLRTCSFIYKEARQVLYADNTFVLALHSGISTLSGLHQRSRSLIKSVTLSIPSHHDILDGFADLVRLGLRYCWGLKKFTIVLDVMFPDDRMIVNGTTSVYANAFHILRWLPKGCKVVLEGNVSEIVRKVVVEEGRLLDELDEVSMPETGVVSEAN